MKKLILRIGWGGLGDHLLYSHLPRIAKQVHHYDKVYISNYSPYRNPQTKELVWEMNPFVDDFCDEGKVVLLGKCTSLEVNLLDEVMLVHNLDDGIRFHEPEIYYKPRIIPGLKDAIIFDPNFVTHSGHPSSSAIKNYFEQHNIHITHQMRLMNNNHPIECKKELCDKSLKHFCDMLNSCKTLYCLNTGTAQLAASIGKSAWVLYAPKMNPRFLYTSKLHTYTKLRG